ncbi:FAD-dependent oxidoreductase [Aeromicrobium fastidiosum]|uniref:ferredoxin--NADP(+) reductase n=1 Tax=Aeromicrobium fastidiosum TaxID=52699 RepID=A0A641AS76_9ACTN|nr:FAD-dependent oxidoreductase [Aeromicrobium fastidiosum]KAA1379921.1 ferredoxin--NADP(+) reductase [Aeromicrobium fastidiosum]MBP2389427.1 ferredoxin--NADP+ reductase [Aeromicrobium fastidiosum]
MTHVITHDCCNDGSCITVCPVQCIRPRPGDADFTTAEQLYVDPESCIDCGACLDACPIDAVQADYLLPADLSHLLELNAEYFVDHPITDNMPEPDVYRKPPADREPLRVAVIGSGPAACYLADEISQIRGASVSLFERLPVPFGLARAGVAPDHPSTKRIVERFRDVLLRPHVECFFNVEVGAHVSVDELLRYHHAVVIATGATSDGRIHVPGETLAGSHSARELVGWYNGSPDHADDTYDFDTARAVVIGNGNVALDVARVLARDPEHFTRTDMADHAIEALRHSAVREVVVAARRGPAHAAYSTGELRALARIEGVDLLVSPDELTGSEETALWRHDVLRAASDRTPSEGNRRIVLRYGLTPTSIDDDGNGRVRSITFSRADGSPETLETGLVLRAAGYRGLPFSGLPYDEGRGTVANERGRVTDPETGTAHAGVYCSGWIKRGPSGGIGTNKVDSAETTEALWADYVAGRLHEPQGDQAELAALVAERQPATVDKDAWLRIDAAERSRGRAADRPRVTFVRVSEMLATAHAPR